MLGNTGDFVSESDKKKSRVKNCKRKDHGTLPRKKKGRGKKHVFSYLLFALKESGNENENK